MSRFALLPLLLLALLPARADSWLQNGDFSDGNSHWYGEAKWPSDFAPPDPMTPADPFTSQGMIIQLKGADWVKEFQDFKGKTAEAVLTITYVLSPGFAFSQKPDDYQNVPDKIGWDAWLPFNAPVNSWVVFISELESRHGVYYLLQPKLDSTAEQKVRLHISGMTPWSAKTMALVFPPGNGTLVIKSIDVTDPTADESTTQ